MNEMDQLISQYQKQSERKQEINDIRNGEYDTNVDYKELSKEEVKITEEKHKSDMKITKKVFSVKIMNDYEKAKAKGAKETLKFITKYLYTNTDFKYNVDSGIEQFKDAGVFEKIAYICSIPLASVIIFMSLPLTGSMIVGYILFKTGKSAIELYNQIKSAPEVESELKRLGKYELIMDNLKKIIKEADNTYFYEPYVTESQELLEGRKLA